MEKRESFERTAIPKTIMGVYTKDEAARVLAANYIRILAISFVPMAISSIVITMLRCMEQAALPLYASIFSLVLNTGLNYMLIFGKWIFPKLGVEGAAWATVIAQTISCLIILFSLTRIVRKKKFICLRIGNKKIITQEIIGNSISGFCVQFWYVSFCGA